MNGKSRSRMLFVLLVFICCGAAFYTGVAVGKQKVPSGADDGSLVQAISGVRRPDQSGLTTLRLDSLDVLPDRKAVPAPGQPGTRRETAKAGSPEKAVNSATPTKASKDAATGFYAVKVAEFPSRREAVDLLTSLTMKGYAAYVAAPAPSKKPKPFIVLIGPFRTKEEASNTVEKLSRENGGRKYRIVESDRS